MCEFVYSIKHCILYFFFFKSIAFCMISLQRITIFNILLKHNVMVHDRNAPFCWPCHGTGNLCGHSVRFHSVVGCFVITKERVTIMCPFVGYEHTTGRHTRFRHKDVRRLAKKIPVLRRKYTVLITAETMELNRLKLSFLSYSGLSSLLTTLLSLPLYVCARAEAELLRGGVTCHPPFKNTKKRIPRTR